MSIFHLKNSNWLELPARSVWRTYSVRLPSSRTDGEYGEGQGLRILWSQEQLKVAPTSPIKLNCADREFESAGIDVMIAGAAGADVSTVQVKTDGALSFPLTI